MLTNRTCNADEQHHQAEKKELIAIEVHVRVASSSRRRSVTRRTAKATRTLSMKSTCRGELLQAPWRG